MCCGESKSSVSLSNAEYKKIDNILHKYSDYEGNLISILQKIQGEIKYLPKEAMAYLAEKTGIKESKIFGVVTFYTQFRTEPVGKHLIMLCQGTACHVNGSKKIEEAITEKLGIEEGGTTEDELFTFTNVACLGCCSLAPVMMIGDTTYGNLTPEKTKEVLEKLQKEG